MGKLICSAQAEDPWRAFYMEKLKKKTLWIIVLGSSVLFLLSPLLASYIGSLADQILSRIWAQTVNPSTVWSFINAGEYIYGAVLVVLILPPFVLGSRAAYLIYKRYKWTDN